MYRPAFTAKRLQKFAVGRAAHLRLATDIAPPTPKVVADLRPPSGSNRQKTMDSAGARRDPRLIAAMPSASKKRGNDKAIAYASLVFRRMLISLIFQIWPFLFWGLLWGIDVRNWSWKVIIGANAAIVLTLIYIKSAQDS